MRESRVWRRDVSFGRGGGECADLGGGGRRSGGGGGGGAGLYLCSYVAM